MVFIQSFVFPLSPCCPVDPLEYAQLSASDRINHLGLTDNYSHGFLRNLWQAAGKECSPAQFAAQVFAAVIPTSALYSLSLAHIVNFYLDEDKKAARDKIVELAKSEDKNASAEIMKYVSEALSKWPLIIILELTLTRASRIGPSSKTHCL